VGINSNLNPNCYPNLTVTPNLALTCFFFVMLRQIFHAITDCAELTLTQTPTLTLTLNPILTLTLNLTLTCFLLVMRRQISHAIADSADQLEAP
jgi:hypothetical protein